jgi:hypothetical protein
MRKKIIVINLGLLSLFFAPTVLFRFNSRYECSAGVFGTTNKKYWRASAPKYKQAAAKAISECKSSSDRPDRCDVLACENYFF